jgi:hypothetical protein
VKRVAQMALLVALSVFWSLPSAAQGTGAQEYGRQSHIQSKKQAKLLKKSTNKRQKQMNKYSKKQRKAQQKAAKQEDKRNYKY